LPKRAICISISSLNRLARCRRSAMRQKILGLWYILAVGLVLLAAAPGSLRAARPEAAPAAAADTAPAGGVSKGEGDLLGDELQLGTLVVTIIIFVCLFLVLRKWAWKPILMGLQNREQAIRDSIEAAQKAKAEAERTTRELEAKMAEVQRQSSAQLQQAKADAIKVADTIRAQAEAESTALKDRTIREIEAAKQQAVSEINMHAAVLGTAVARKILQRNVTADDQQRLVEESLAEMAQKN
jgi:F-type H+-transporting ATPase subunit b